MPRPKGSPNRPKRRLLALLQEQYPDYHPVLEMARIAHESNDTRIRADMHKEVARYVEPVLKAVELSSDPDRPVAVRTSVLFVPATISSEPPPDEP